MVTKITIPIDLKKESVAVTLEDKDHPIIPGEKVKLYIPSVMANIKQTSPTITKVPVKINTIFTNDAGCKPKSKNVLDELNYIESIMEYNCTSDNIVVNGTVPNGTKVQASFVNGKLKSPVFNTNLY